MSSSLIVGYERTSPHLVVNIPKDGTRINGDRALSEEACDKIATFVLEHHPNSYNSREINYLKVKPLNSSDLELAISIIDSRTTRVVRVDNEVNRDPRDGLVYVATKSELRQGSDFCAALIKDGRLSVAALSSAAKIEFLFISQNAYNALRRYKAQVEKNLYSRLLYQAPAYQRREERQMLLPREKGCCEKVSDCVSSVFDPSYCARKCFAILCGASCLGVTAFILYRVIEQI